MNANFFNVIIVAPLTAIIGIYPYIRRPNEVTKYFALANVALAIWNVAELQTLLPIEHQTALLFYRLSYVAGILMVPFSFRFIFAFIGVDLNSMKVLWGSVVALAGFLVILAPTRFLIADVLSSPTLPLNEIQGPLYPLFGCYLLGGSGYALYRLFKTYTFLEGHRKNQHKYLFAALSVAFVEAICFFVSTWYLNLPTYYYYLQIIYVLLISYAIVAHRLMDITVIVRKTAIYSIVTGALTAVYLLVATLLAKVLEGAGGRAGFWASAIAAAAITLLFHPLLNRVRSFMDRQFFGDWLRDMSRGVVHEVKRPLASISMPAQLTLLELEDIEQGKLSFASVLPELKERMRVIVQKTIEAADRIEALYALSDSSGRPSKPVDVVFLVKTSLSAAKSIIDRYLVNVNLAVAPDLAAVKGDIRQFEIVFVNLIKNALEAMSSVTQRSLNIRAYDDGKWIAISIKDSGPGISAADRELLFDPHFTTKGSNGMGLGLYLSERIVRENGGSIEVKSEEGKGTEFVVRLPKFEVARAA
jgi:signal transduction histidine kinase